MKNFLNFQRFNIKKSDNPYFLPSVNPIFHGLSFGIKFIIGSIENSTGTPLAKYFSDPVDFI
jgi:hypothetical protein